MRVRLLAFAMALICSLGMQAQLQRWGRVEAQANNLRLEAVDLMRQGQFAEAAPVLEQLIAMQGVPRQSRAVAMRDLGICLRQLGHYSRSAKVMRQALDLLPDADQALLDSISFSLCNSLLLSGQHEEAIDRLLAIATPQYDARRHLSLANAYFRRSLPGDEDRALSSLDAAIGLLADAPAADRAAAYQNRGYILLNRGHYAQAAADTRRAADAYGWDTADGAAALGNLALAVAAQDSVDQALTILDRALRWQAANLGDTHPDYIINMRKRAEILHAAGRPQAEAAYREYFQADKAYTLRQMTGYNEQQRLNLWKMKNPLMTQVFRLGSVADAAFLYDAALFRRQMTLMLHNTPDLAYATSATSAALRRAMAKGEAAVEIVAYFDPHEGDSVYCAVAVGRDFAPRYGRLWSKRQLHGYDLGGAKLAQAVVSDLPRHKNLIYSDSALAERVWQPILRLLPPNINKVYFAPDGLLQLLAIEYLPAPALDQLDAVRVSSTARLLERGAKRPANGHGTLVMGALDYNTVDAEAQADGGDHPNHEAADYLRSQMPGGRWFEYLAGSKAEVEHIDSVVPGATVVRRASEESVKHLLGRYAQAHFSTHGYAMHFADDSFKPALRDSLTEDRSLLASGLALTGANVAWKNPAHEDCLLCSREIGDLDLANLDFVALSACQSAVGIVSDEGPAGLVRGFKKAGANVILASLWSVSDDATTLLMHDFYDQVSRGIPRRQALRTARQRLRARGYEMVPYFDPGAMATRLRSTPSDSPRARHIYDQPYYWAPFILIDAID